jgi:hypothetical protein
MAPQALLEALELLVLQVQQDQLDQQDPEASQVTGVKQDQQARLGLQDLGVKLAFLVEMEMLDP